jgi:hypothetical protein
MPLDVLGRTRATLTCSASYFTCPERAREILLGHVVLGIDLCNYRS